MFHLAMGSNICTENTYMESDILPIKNRITNGIIVAIMAVRRRERYIVTDALDITLARWLVEGLIRNISIID